MRRLLIVLVLVAATAGTTVLGGQARGFVITCSPTTDLNCQTQQHNNALALFAALNHDIGVFPPSPIKTPISQLAMHAESLYPPSPISPQSFCASFGAFDGLVHQTGALLNKYPPSPVHSALLAVHTAAMNIVGASIWTFYPPAPIAPQTSACIG